MSKGKIFCRPLRLPQYNCSLPFVGSLNELPFCMCTYSTRTNFGGGRENDFEGSLLCFAFSFFLKASPSSFAVSPVFKLSPYEISESAFIGGTGSRKKGEGKGVLYSGAHVEIFYYSYLHNKF